MGLLSRLRDRRGQRGEPPPEIDSPDLEVVAESFDHTEADSTALARATTWRPTIPAVLRHHLKLPPDQHKQAETLLAQDGWTLIEGEVSYALRVQLLTPLSCAQERGRMASLAQRLGGEWIGWDALQRPGEVRQGSA